MNFGGMESMRRGDRKGDRRADGAWLWGFAKQPRKTFCLTKRAYNASCEEKSMRSKI